MIRVKRSRCGNAAAADIAPGAGASGYAAPAWWWDGFHIA